jgi:hypothetical protein
MKVEKTKGKKVSKDKLKKVKDKKGKKVVKAKKEKVTGGFPKIIVLTKDEDGFLLHDEQFSDINEDSVVGIYSFRRVTNVEVQRKQKRTAKE